MPCYRSAGSVPRKRHSQHRRPDGGLYDDELVGEEGFSSDSSLRNHAGIPSALVDARPWQLPDQATEPKAPLLPRHLRLNELFPDQDWKAVNPVTGRRLVLGNANVRLSYVVAGRPRPRPRRHRDECVYVEAGAATIETAFGNLEVGQGDDVLLPRATTHRRVPTGDEPQRLYAIEASSHIGRPRGYLSKHGQFFEHAPYCERDLRVPTGPRVVEQTDVEVYVKHRGPGAGGLVSTVHVMPQHPFDVVGRDGCLSPYAFDIADDEPMTGRVHRPPPLQDARAFCGEFFHTYNHHHRHAGLGLLTPQVVQAGLAQVVLHDLRPGPGRRAHPIQQPGPPIAPPDRTTGLQLDQQARGAATCRHSQLVEIYCPEQVDRFRRRCGDGLIRATRPAAGHRRTWTARLRWRHRSHEGDLPAPRKYPNELRERAQRLVGETREQERSLQPPASGSAATQRPALRLVRRRGPGPAGA